MFIVSAIDGISSAHIDIWNLARELYIPSLILITDLTNGETDFDDMSAIAGRMLDPVQTPYLVLHDDNGNPTALINLDSLKLSDYSTGHRVERDSDPEHKVLVFEFRKEYLEAIEEFGESGFQDGLSFPAIPFIPESLPPERGQPGIFFTRRGRSTCFPGQKTAQLVAIKWESKVTSKWKT